MGFFFFFWGGGGGSFLFFFFFFFLPSLIFEVYLRIAILDVKKGQTLLLLF